MEIAVIDIVFRRLFSAPNSYQFEIYASMNRTDYSQDYTIAVDAWPS